MKIGFLWSTPLKGFSSVHDFDAYYKFVGRNNGNMVFVHALAKQFKGEYVQMPWHAPADVINASCDVVILPAANQLGPHVDLGDMGRKIREITVPFIAIGLGAQSDNLETDIALPGGTLDWLEAIIENGVRHGICNIYTRGPYTSGQIRKITGAETIPGGCPSHFISENPELGQAVARNWASCRYPRSIAVAAGHEAWMKTRTIEQQLVSLMMDPFYPGVYIPQSMEPMVKISRREIDTLEDKTLAMIRDHTAPHYTGEQIRMWANRFARSYCDVSAWAEELRRHDLAIGARYHGTALALQTEVMGCTVTIDSRTEEMCRETGVPFIRADDFRAPITRRALKEDIVRFDADAYDALRKTKCARYVAFAEGCGLEVADYLKVIAGA